MPFTGGYAAGGKRFPGVVRSAPVTAPPQTSSLVLALVIGCLPAVGSGEVLAGLAIIGCALWIKTRPTRGQAIWLPSEAIAPVVVWVRRRPAMPL
jgi:hypothetical protein